MKYLRYVLALIIQIVIILGFAGYYAQIADQGREVYLRVMPLDPTDPFRGDYVEFQLGVTEIPAYQFMSKTSTSQGFPYAEFEGYQEGDEVYVDLVKYNQKYSEVSQVWPTYPTNPQGVVIRGMIDRIGQGSEGSPVVRVTYGIEQYFIPEGTGRDENFTNKDVIAQVRISRTGTAILQQLYINSTPWPR